MHRYTIWYDPEVHKVDAISDTVDLEVCVTLITFKKQSGITNTDWLPSNSFRGVPGCPSRRVPMGCSPDIVEWGVINSQLAYFGHIRNIPLLYYTCRSQCSDSRIFLILSYICPPNKCPAKCGQCERYRKCARNAIWTTSWTGSFMGLIRVKNPFLSRLYADPSKPRIDEAYLQY